MKLLNIISGLLLAVFFNTAFAEDTSCPPLKTVRANVNFERAMQIGESDKYGWGLVSKAFEYNEAEWAGIFFVKLPDAKYPEQAVRQGQAFFDSSILQRAKAQQQEGEHKLCDYSIESANYRFYLETPVDYGFARLAK